MKHVWKILAAAVLGVLPVIAGATSLTTLYSFPNENPKPFSPNAGLVELHGMFYGTTYYGGASGRGTVFKVNPATGATTIVHSFSGTDGQYPDAALIAVGSTLYGTTYQGGASGFGTVFKVVPGSGTEVVLHSFSSVDGQYPAASVLHINGILYGTASAGGGSGDGTVFKIDTATGIETTLYSFAGGIYDGATPLAGLIDVGGTLYGTTANGGDGGTIYTINPITGAEAVSHYFGSFGDGASPQAPLLHLGQYIYGTTAGTGSSYSTVFKLDLATKTYTSMHNFQGIPVDGSAANSALIAYKGNLYGTTQTGGPKNYGVIYRIDPLTGVEKTLAAFNGTTGSSPHAALTILNGTLYGTTAGGTYYTSGPHAGESASLSGTIFKFDPATHALKALATFPGINPVYQGISSPVSINSLLYGATQDDGPGGDSAIFTLNPTTHAEATLASLGSRYLSSAAPILLNGTLYGTTGYGGSTNSGTVFSVDPSTGAMATVYSFTNNNDGARPSAALLAVGSMLYGTAQTGGSGSGGTVFSVNPATGAETTLYSFTLGNDGGYPSSNLISVGGLLYGTAMLAGPSASYGGVVFSVNPQTGAETVVHAFTGGFTGGPDGEFPNSGVVDVGSLLYGNTQYGGPQTNDCPSGCGAAYSLNPTNGAETILHLFSGGADGGNPDAGLLQVGGTLYGTTSVGGTFGYGSIFSIGVASGTFTSIYSFTGGDDGATPRATLVDVGGVIYGTTDFGGPGNAGTVFTLTP